VVRQIRAGEQYMVTASGILGQSEMMTPDRQVDPSENNACSDSG
jgi:hypothetical protein